MKLHPQDEAILKSAQTLIMGAWIEYETNPEREEFYSDLVNSLIELRNKYSLNYDFKEIKP